LKSARRLVLAGADSVKIEECKCDVIRHLAANDIAVVSHLGLTPQTATSFAQVGRTENEAKRIRSEAFDVQQAGAFLVVLEHIPAAVAASITDSLVIPTIGIGAGLRCDGQVLVINDAIGLGEKWPPFSKQYVKVGEMIQLAATLFRDDVENQNEIRRAVSGAKT